MTFTGRSHYQRGAAFERAVGKRLSDDGYWVIRASGSHGEADLVAIKPGQVVLVNCKLPGPGGVPPAEWNALWALSVHIGALAVVAHRPARGKVEYLRLVGPKTQRVTRIAPVRPWTPDDAAENLSH